MIGLRKIEYFLDNDFLVMILIFDLDIWFKVIVYFFFINNILIKFKND